MIAFIIGVVIGFVAGVLVGRRNKAAVETAVSKGREASAALQAKLK